MANALLMHKDVPVLTFAIDKEFMVLNENLLPWRLKGALRSLSKDDMNSTQNISKYASILTANTLEVLKWLASRTLSLSRRNGKKLYNLIQASQDQSDHSKAKLALMCRAVSAEDSYWVKMETDPIKWKDVNVRSVPLNDIVTQVALHGSSLSLQGSLTTPEYATHGAYAKGWRRHDDGKLWLYKLSNTDSSFESNVEVTVSNLLDKTNVRHCHYEASYDKGKYVCICPNLATEELSLVSGEEFVVYCNRNSINPDSLLKKLSETLMYQMWVVDYIISNTDRHARNWGLYYKCDVGELVGLHPLFDHNNAFDSEAMKSSDFNYVFNNKSAKECAQFAMRRCEVKFKEPISKRDFLTAEHWESFQERCGAIGLKYK